MPRHRRHTIARSRQLRLGRAILVVLLVLSMGRVLSPMNPEWVQAAGAHIFGTLETDPNQAAQEYAAGVRVVLQTVSWKDYEPQDGVFNATYMSGIKQRIQTFLKA